jgi:hypothetical protein
MDIPSEYICPITHDTMKEPVYDNEGNTYEKYAIERWLSSHNTSPISRRSLYIRDLRPNIELKKSIYIFMVEYKKQIELLKIREARLKRFVNSPEPPGGGEPVTKQYHCDHGCGYLGGWDDVVNHERTCRSHEPEPEPEPIPEPQLTNPYNARIQIINDDETKFVDITNNTNNDICFCGVKGNKFNEDTEIWYLSIIKRNSKLSITKKEMISFNMAGRDTIIYMFIPTEVIYDYISSPLYPNVYPKRLPIKCVRDISYEQYKTLINTHGYPAPGYNRLGWSITVNNNNNIDFTPI